MRLRATTKDLANALDIDAATFTAWERGEEFPTKRYVELMARLDEEGPDALPRAPTRRGSSNASKKAADPMSVMADPTTWSLFRKILAHADLRDAVTKLASGYDDPAG